MKNYNDEIEAFGQEIGDMLNIPRVRSKGYDKGQFRTKWGTKTGFGLYLTIERMIEDVQIEMKKRYKN